MPKHYRTISINEGDDPHKVLESHSLTTWDGIGAVLGPLLSEVSENTLSTEDTLTPLYRERVTDVVDETNDTLNRLNGITRPIVNTIRAGNSGADQLLSRLPTLVREDPDGQIHPIGEEVNLAPIGVDPGTDIVKPPPRPPQIVLPTLPPDTGLCVEPRPDPPGSFCVLPFPTESPPVGISPIVPPGQPIPPGVKPPIPPGEAKPPPGGIAPKPLPPAPGPPVPPGQPAPPGQPVQPGIPRPGLPPVILPPPILLPPITSLPRPGAPFPVIPPGSTPFPGGPGTGQPPITPPTTSPPEVSPPSEGEPSPEEELPPDTPPNGQIPDELQLPIRDETACIWEPIDPAICRDVEQWLAAIVALGETVVGPVMSLVSRNQATKEALKLTLGTVPIVGVVFNAIIDAIEYTEITGLFSGLSRLLTSMQQRSTKQLVSLYAAQAVVRALESTSAGWELGPQLLVTLRVELVQIRRVVDYLIEYACPVVVPSLPEIRDLYLSDVITQDHGVCLSRMHGQTPGVTVAQFNHSRTKPDPFLLIRDWMRFRYPVDLLHLRLRQQGWTDHSEREELIRSHEFLPPPTDLIRFAVRDVYNPAKLGVAQMRTEYREQIGLRELLDAQGIGQIKIRDRDGNERTYDSGEDYWLAHYQNVSPTQVFEMLHRLRPDRVGKFALPGPDGRPIVPEPVTLQAVRQLLKEDDFNPYWRDRLAAISYRVLTRIDVRRVYKTGGFGEPQGKAGFRRNQDGTYTAIGDAEKELVAVNQDAGYTLIDATRLAWYTASELDRVADSVESKRQRKLLCDTYQHGVIAASEFVRQLELTGLTRKQSEDYARVCDVTRRLRDVKATMTSTKKLYMRAEIDAIAARTLLSQAGVRPERITELLRLWAIEIRIKPREATVSQLCQWYQDGTLTLPQMRVRLSLLGYDSTDIERIVKHCVLGQNAKEQSIRDRRRRAEERERRRAEADAKARRKEQERLTAKRLAQFLSARSDSNLVAWYRAGLITEDEIRLTLSLRGFSDEDIDRWVKTKLTPAEGGQSEGDREG